MCSFRLQNFAKCLRAVKIASPRDGLRKGKGCKMLVIRRDSTKTKSKANPTLLRTATKDSVLNFSWRAIGQEILEKSPLFYRLLLASADPKSLSKSSDPETTERYRCLAQKPQQRHELRSLCHQHHSQGREDFKTGKHKVVCFPRCLITSFQTYLNHKYYFSNHGPGRYQLLILVIPHMANNIP